MVEDVVVDGGTVVVVVLVVVVVVVVVVVESLDDEHDARRATANTAIRILDNMSTQSIRCRSQRRRP